MISRSRLIYLLSFISIGLLLGLVFYLQKYDGLNPCPLCVLQRMVMAALGVVFFFGAVLTLGKVGKILLAILSALVAAAGIFLAGRQVWLQHLPPNTNADCGASLQYLMQVLPFDQVVKKVFQGTAECSQLGWQFLGRSMAEWSLFCFILFLLVALYQVFLAKQK